MLALVEIVYDPNKGKYRARPVGKQGWVRFPNHLRVAGALYQVENLKEGKSGSWIASGRISPVMVSQCGVSYRRAA